MIINVQSRLQYDVLSPTSFIFNIAAASTERQVICAEKLTISPDMRVVDDLVDLSENRIYRLEAEPGPLTVEYVATVRLEARIDTDDDLGQSDQIRIPDEALPYLYPSRYCPSDRLGRWAAKNFGGQAQGASRVNAVCDWIYDALDYLPGVTDEHTDACEVLIKRAGVCRDFAHVAITICRALGMPARYVSGYAVDLDPPDFHGFFEVYLGDAWYLFDATKLAPVAGFARIGAGRDAADCSFAMIVGAANFLEMSVSATSDGPRLELSSADEISTA